MNNDTKIISCKGQTLETKHFCEISDSDFENIKNTYYSKPNFNNVVKEFKNLYNGGTKHSDITKYYVKDLMAKTRIYYNKWSIEDVFECKDLVSFFVSKTLENKKIFPDTDSVSKKIETAIRLGGKGVASKPANFPIKTVDEILSKYNVNNYWYDYSYCGSETFIPEWENKIGLAFSSPPYFYLEDYKIGKQSYTPGTTYEDWKEKYLRPTIKNINKYLINNGNFLININNFLDYDLVSDTRKIAEGEGFVWIENYQLDNIKRCKSLGGFNDNSEKIMVFQKRS